MTAWHEQLRRRSGEERAAAGTVVAKEVAEGRASFLLHLEVVVHGHLLHSRQKAVVGIHYGQLKQKFCQH
jgi:hypothetical protein